eukprot:CAMPEP_0182503334 /NCGR_PEP_ID=MMETSP1321-20130603/15141_1 /TAXON_ID=91990 /ORGANISM="Bolidomonas sp., Strain RCC1657" /LENGTH=112 /DNA_ID=CAMNT_0024708487 /DNA_START=756 /DNA_END=1094 /DNA_ORIENTATION=-
MSERTWTRPAAAPGRPPPRAFLPALRRILEMDSGEGVMREPEGRGFLGLDTVRVVVREVFLEVLPLELGVAPEEARDVASVVASVEGPTVESNEEDSGASFVLLRSTATWSA